MPLTTLDLLLPTFCTGVLLSGLVLFGYSLRSFPTPLNRVLTLVSAIGVAYAALEVAVLVAGGQLQNFELGALLNLIQELTVSWILVAIPLLLATLAPLRGTVRLLNRILLATALAFMVLLLIAVPVQASWFVSLGEARYEVTTYMGDYALGARGPLIIVRDILMSVYLLYAAVTLSVSAIVNRKLLSFGPYVLGILLAVIFGADALYVNFTGNYLAPLAQLEYSRTVLGISLMIAFSMAGSFRDFVTKAREVELAHGKLVASEQELVFQAYHDQLTEVGNRKAFYERLERLLYHGQRHGMSHAILYIDLDHFKEVNDSYGHRMGDVLLRHAVRRIARHTRNTDDLFRLGGDEFILILADIVQPTDAAIVAEKLLKAFSAPFHAGGMAVYLGLSVGISLYPSDGAEREELIRKADEALYEAKRYRNTYRFFTSELNSEADAKIRIINGMRDALRTNGFRLHYQAIFDAHARIVGAEALLRWPEKSSEQVGPGVFVPLAEASGLIGEIGAWVLQRAIEDTVAMHARGFEGFVSINISVKQLYDAKIVNTFAKLLAQSGARAEWFHLEITETSLMETSVREGKILSALRDLGLSLSVDDFGTGFASLSYLKSMPVGCLKIDRSFVRLLPEDTRDAAIVNAVISMARGLGLGVIVEGVETREQESYVLGLDQVYIQGYFRSRPEPLEVFLARALESEATGESSPEAAVKGGGEPRIRGSSDA